MAHPKILQFNGGHWGVGNGWKQMRSANCILDLGPRKHKGLEGLELGGANLGRLLESGWT